MKTYEMERGRVPVIINLSSRWRCLVTSHPGSFSAKKESQGPMELKARWASELVWTFWR